MAEDSFWLRPLAWDIAFFCLWIWSDLIQFEIEPHNNLQMRFVLPPLVSGTKSHTGNTGCWLQGSWQDRVGWSGVGKRQVKMPDFHSIFKLFFFFLDADLIWLLWIFTYFPVISQSLFWQFVFWCFCGVWEVGTAYFAIFLVPLLGHSLMFYACV